MNYSEIQTVAGSMLHTHAEAQQSMDRFCSDKLTQLRSIREGLVTIGDLLDDNSGESVPKHPLTDQQRVGLIFALKGLVGGLGECVDDLDYLMDVVGKALAIDEPVVVGRAAS